MSDRDAEPGTTQSLADTVQAHLGRASRFVHGGTRNWSIFFFFRILTQAEIGRDIRRLGDMTAADAQKNTVAIEAIINSLIDPALMNTGIVEQELVDWRGKPPETDGDDTNGKAADAPDMPAQLFLDWLHLVTGADAKRLTASLQQLFASAGMPSADYVPVSVSDEEKSATEKSLNDNIAKAAVELSRSLGELVDQPGGLQRILAAFPKLLPSLFANPGTMRTLLWASASAIGERRDKRLPVQLLNTVAAEFTKLFSGATSFEQLLEKFGTTAGAAGAHALSGGLLLVCLYELLRHVAPAHLDGGKGPGIMRSEGAEDAVPKPGTGQRSWDPAPINIAFTYSGLEALKLDEAVLASFPDPFKEGMAARAERLGDSGPSAPEHWDGALGLKRVHGYFAGGFFTEDEQAPAHPDLWQALRDDARAFNERSGDLGMNLRLVLNMLFRLIGMELMHVEIGEDPYEIGDHGEIKRPDHRTEHFGFRDGISQPFVNMGLGDPPSGGGTPRRNRSWAPVAPGEIFLDQMDEDGNLHQQPAHPLLRQGSTYLVFRKLEQDVAGFRIYLSRQRPRDAEAQERLAAQFMGRWKNGTPLVVSPDAPQGFGRDPDGLVNDFLYAADDPSGRNCPLGAHIRRTNPRDIGGTDDVRRHRILRRSISYGGPLLNEGAIGDGNDRGLLFIAANARIDLQFEVIQANWINKGEFLGQAGLGRCPITGANDGGLMDTFIEAGTGVPVTGLPRFVITRGGDYFFAPGLPALRAIADGCKFVVDPRKLPYGGRSMGDTNTPVLFSEERLSGYAARLLTPGQDVIRLSMPQPGPSEDPAAGPVAFVGKHADVSDVLSIRLDPQSKKIVHSVALYRMAGRRISRGDDLVIGTEPGSPTDRKRRRMLKILNRAWEKVGTAEALHARLRMITNKNIEAALRRTGPTKRIDLVHDLAAVPVYHIVKEIFGVPGPPWLSELAIALPFARQHFGELHQDWLAAVQNQKPDNLGLATLQIWSILLFADIIGNYAQQQELMALSSQAGSEFLTHLDQLLTLAGAKQAMSSTKDDVGPSANLIEAFVAIEKEFVKPDNPDYTSLDYRSEVRMLLMELTGSAVAIIPTTFGSVMSNLLDFGIDLTRLVPILLGSPQFLDPGSPPVKESGLKRLIFEAWRLNPTFKLLMRFSPQGATLPSGGSLMPGDWVAALVAAANFDGSAFPRPLRFSLHPFLPGPKRPIENYLLFGAPKGGRDCWGRDRLAFYLLEECVKAAGRLQDLRRVAGENGELKKLAQVNVGLSARFRFVHRGWPRHPVP